MRCEYGGCTREATHAMYQEDLVMCEKHIYIRQKQLWRLYDRRKQEYIYRRDHNLTVMKVENKK